MSDNNQTLPSNNSKSEMFKQQDFSEENSVNENGISLYIPFVFTYVTRQMITEKMEEKIWYVHRVDIEIATNSKGQRHKKVYVHFKQNSWYDTEDAKKTLDTLKSGESVQLSWVDNWFWKIYISKSKRIENRTYNSNSNSNSNK